MVRAMMELPRLQYSKNGPAGPHRPVRIARSSSGRRGLARDLLTQHLEHAGAVVGSQLGEQAGEQVHGADRGRLGRVALGLGLPVGGSRLISAKLMVRMNIFSRRG